MRNCSFRTRPLFAPFALATIAVVNAGQIEIQTETRTKQVDSPVEYRVDPSVPRGKIVKTSGTAGSVRKTVRVTYDGHKPVKFEKLAVERTPAKPTVYRMSRGLSSRSSFVRGRVMTMHASAYDPSPATIGRGATGRCANGMRARYGVVAVDPRVIPLGTTVFVEGYGLAIAADTGGAIKGRRIDLCFNSRSSALRFGRKKVRVHVLRPR